MILELLDTAHRTRRDTTIIGDVSLGVGNPVVDEQVLGEIQVESDFIFDSGL
jgi:hypothetical protein